MPAPTTPASGFGEHLRDKRKAAGLTQQEASKRVGVKQATWSAWESGGHLPGGHRLAQLERVLGIDRMIWMAAVMSEGGSQKTCMDHYPGDLGFRPLAAAA